MKDYLKRGVFSFMISSFCGIIVNLIIDLVMNTFFNEGFISISPHFLKLFPTPVMAAYVNMLLYGLIGFTFSTMTFVFDLERMSFLVQSIIYFLVTSVVYVMICVVLWQLHKHPEALIGSLLGYAASYAVMCVIMYKSLKKDMEEINNNIQ